MDFYDPLADLDSFNAGDLTANDELTKQVDSAVAAERTRQLVVGFEIFILFFTVFTSVTAGGQIYTRDACTAFDSDASIEQVERFYTVSILTIVFAFVAFVYAAVMIAYSEKLKNSGRIIQNIGSTLIDAAGAVGGEIKKEVRKQASNIKEMRNDNKKSSQPARSSISPGDIPEEFEAF